MNLALLLSGGTGERLPSAVPKQYVSVAGRTVIAWCLDSLAKCALLDGVQIVAAPAWRDTILADMPGNLPFLGFSDPGETRQLSILNGLRDLSRTFHPSDAVLVHDAVRPFVPEALLRRCLTAMEGHEGVMPVLPVTDTVYESRDGVRIARLLERDHIYAGQAPEAFRLGPYLSANEDLGPDRILSIRGATEPAALGGLDMVLVAGEPGNFKITTPEDLDRCRMLLERE